MFGGDLAGHMVLEFHRFLFCGDADHFAAGAAIDRELFAKRILGRHQQTRFFFNRSADMVGQSAVCIGNIRSALDHQDFGFFIQPAQPRGARRSAGHSTYDDDFHFSSS